MTNRLTSFAVLAALIVMPLVTPVLLRASVAYSRPFEQTLGVDLRKR